MDRGHRRAAPVADASDGEDEHRRARAVDALRHPEADRRAEEHHPLDPEVEDAGALGEQLAEGRVEERRPVEHRLREHDHEQAVVDLRRAPRPAPVRHVRSSDAVSAAGSGASSSPPRAQKRMIPCITPTSPDGKSGPCSVKPAFRSPPMSTATRQTANGL